MMLALRALPWKLIGLSALALAFLGLVAALKIERSQNAKLQAQIELVQAARVADELAYKAAQAESARLNLEQVRKVEQRQSEINDELQSSWNADRARLADIMRSKGGANQGSAKPAALPRVPTTPGGPNDLRVCLAEGDALSAAQNELRLFYLQEWVREQLKINR
jgi:hypothetical protein